MENLLKYPLHLAARKGDLDRMKQLIGMGMFIDSRGIDNDTPLHCAAEHGELETVKYIISQNCDINAKNTFSRTPVMKSASANQVDIVFLLIHAGANINDRDNWSRTLLHIASAKGLAEVVKYCLENGNMNVNGRDVTSHTPLMRAAEEGHNDVVELLLEHGADVNCRDWKSQTALHFALRYKKLDVVGPLLKAGVDVNFRNDKHETALNCWFLVKPETWKTDCQTLTLVRALVKHGAYLDDSDYGHLVSVSRRHYNSLAKVAYPYLEIMHYNILKDSEVCAQAIINRFNNKSLPSVYSKPALSARLSGIEMLEIKSEHVAASNIKEWVEHEIHTKAYCNIVVTRPIVLKLMCVEALMNHQLSFKRPSADVNRGANSPVKKLRLN